MTLYNRNTRIQLKDSDAGPVRFLSGPHVHLGEIKKNSTTITILRTGSFSHPRYGRFEITRELFEGMVRNFEAETYGQEIFMDVAHEPQKGSAGDIRKLFIDGARLRAQVEWTEYGLAAIKNRGFKYISADFIENYIDSEYENEHGPVLFGAALVTRPHIKNMDPVQLSQADGKTTITFIHPNTLDHFINEENTVKEFLKKLKEKLEALKLSDSIVSTLLQAFENAAKQLADDSPAIQLLYAEFEKAGSDLAKQLAATDPNAAVTIQLGDISVGNTDNIDEVIAKKLADAQAKQLQDAQKAASTLAERRKLFSDAIEAAEGLSEEVSKQLMAAGELITAEMTAEQVKALSDNQISLGNQMEATRKLAAQGYQVPGISGTPHIQFGDDKSPMQLQEAVHKALKSTSRYASGDLKLKEKVDPFVSVVLGEFDRINAPRIHAEAKRLAGENVVISDTDLPVGFQREVIREALSDLNILSLVQGLTDPTATATTQIPYEVRDDSAVLNDGIVYEAQGIHGASVSQAMDLAYIVPMKLAMKLTNEVIHFSRSSAINWDAYGRNVAMNARIMRELIAKRIANEMQRSSDAYLATAVSNEGLDAQLDGSTSTVKTANFPIVRPFQARDLQGNAIGSAENPITVRLNGTAINEYDGSGTQSAGTYYRITNYNLGYLQYVDQTGTPATPPNAAGADDISYSYATNIVKFDTDIQGTETLEVRLNGLLQAVGARKAVLSGDRFVMPNFLLMSPALNDTATNAEQFAASMKRDGVDTGAQGDLETVKGVPAFGTNAPGIDLGDERILMGQRGTMSYTIAKPFMTGQPFEAVDANGKPTGQKVAYGEEYSAIKVPTPIRNRMTSVIAYSVAARAAV